MNEITKREETLPGGLDINGLMAEAVKGGNAEVIHRLLDAQERIMNKRAQMEYDAAMVELQEELAGVKIMKTGQIKFEGKNKSGDAYSQQTPYAKLEDIDKVLRPVMHKHGFVVTYATEGTDRVVVKCKITHRGGHSETSSMALPLDTSGSKNNLQGAGSSISYGRRYTLCAMLNLITLDDNDGRGAPITDEQAATIKGGLEETGLDVKKFLSNLKVQTVEEIPAKDFARAMTAIDAKRYRIIQEKQKGKPNDEK